MSLKKCDLQTDRLTDKAIHRAAPKKGNKYEKYFIFTHFVRSKWKLKDWGSWPAAVKKKPWMSSK